MALKIPFRTGIRGTKPSICQVIMYPLLICMTYYHDTTIPLNMLIHWYWLEVTLVEQAQSLEAKLGYFEIKYSL